MPKMDYVVPTEGVVTWVMLPGGRAHELTDEGARVDVTTPHHRMLIREGAIRLRDAADTASPPTSKQKRVKPSAEDSHGD